MTEFYWRADQYLRLEEADEELVTMTQISETPKAEAKTKDDNNGGKQKADGNNGSGANNNRSQRFKGGAWYETYIVLTGIIENIYLAT